MNAQTTITAAPSDLQVTEAMIGKLDAEASLAGSSALRNHAISGGIVLGVVGLTAIGCLWAWGQRNPSPEAWQAALDKMPPVKVEVSLDPKSHVKLADGGEVSLKDGGEVKLADGGEVKLADGAIVRLDTASIKLPETHAPGKTEAGDIIRQTVTVFHAVDHAGGAVTTGWEYRDGASKAPQRTYCYFIRPSDDGSDRRISLADDTVPIAANRKLLSNFDQALSKCVWWKGAV